MSEQSSVTGISQEEVFITQGLRNYLMQARQELVQKDQILLQDEILRRIRSIQRRLLPYPAGAARARAFYRLLDETIAGHQEKYPKSWKKISCKAGCSLCCHQMVEISADEADLLAERVEQGLNISREKLKAQAERSDPSSWWRLPWEVSACVFLSKTGRCKVYQDRPLACRKYYVKSPPSSCGPTPSGAAQEVETLIVVECEIIASAALDMGAREGNIATGLLARLGGAA